MRRVVSVSGGKDSGALYMWMVERGCDFTPVFADVGNEHEITYEYVAELPRRVGGPDITWVKADFAPQLRRRQNYIRYHWRAIGTDEAEAERMISLLEPSNNPFLDLCMMKGRFPSAMARFCTEELKIKPITDQIYKPLVAAGHVPVSYQGVRADESFARSKLPMRQKVEVMGVPVRILRPMLNWTLDDVIAKHAKFGVEPNPLYREGWNRVGCMPCVMENKQGIKNMDARYPEHVDRIREWERIVSSVSKRGSATFFHAHPGLFSDPDEPVHYTRHGIDAQVRWAQSGRYKVDHQNVAAKIAEYQTTCDRWGACE